MLFSPVPPRLTSTRRLPSVLATTLSHPAHGVFLSNPCQPHIRFCTKKCPNGFRTGRNGCQYCQCSRYNSAKTTLTGTYHVVVKYVLKRVSFGSKDCTKELKLECAYFLGQTS